MTTLSKNILLDYLNDIVTEINDGNPDKAIEIINVLKDYIKEG